MRAFRKRTHTPFAFAWILVNSSSLLDRQRKLGVKEVFLRNSNLSTVHDEFMAWRHVSESLFPFMFTPQLLGNRVPKRMRGSYSRIRDACLLNFGEA
ncbi:hypothetical protein BDZ45DRAFT_424756 [Acephala macrosclerotiorum]|nr:hypothetical protein BDZ45DRAFT_424756 [Acephala macrosclerotiorum]